MEVGNSNVERLNIMIAPPMTVSGKLRLEGQAEVNLASVRVSLMPRDQSSTPFGLPQPDRWVWMACSTSANVSPDLYNVSLSGLPEGFYASSMQAGGQDVLLAGLNLNAGGSAPVDIVLRANAGQAAGIVQNDQQLPAPNVTVVLAPVEPERRSLTFFYKTATTDAAGLFSFKRLTPGQYRAYAWTKVEPGAYMDADFMTPYKDQGETVVIEEGATADVKLKPIP